MELFTNNLIEGHLVELKKNINIKNTRPTRYISLYKFLPLYALLEIKDSLEADNNKNDTYVSAYYAIFKSHINPESLNFVIFRSSGPF